jgi:hypothetical protein
MYFNISPTNFVMEPVKNTIPRIIRKIPEIIGITFENNLLPDTFPTLSTLSEIIKEKISSETTSKKSKEARENMLASLQPYINGAYSHMFNGQTNWDYDFFTVFDISGLPEAVTQPLYDILLKDTWQFCKQDRQKTRNNGILRLLKSSH